VDVTYRFNGYRVDPIRRILLGPDERPIPLKPRVFDALLYLVEHRGELLGKQALLDAIWPHVVVEENNLNQAISTLRRVFGETRDEHRFIVTEPGRGYRFVARVEIVPAESDARAPISVQESNPERLAPVSTAIPAPVVFAPLEHTVRGPRTAYAVTAAVAAGLGAALFWFLSRDPDGRWLREDLIPQIEARLDAGDWEAAYALAEEGKARAPDASELQELWPRFSWRVTLESKPTGAMVFRRGYDSTDADWRELGRTPLKDIRVPFGLSRLRLELDGYAPLSRTLGSGLLVAGPELTPVPSADVTEASKFFIPPELYALDRIETLPEGKVHVPGWSQTIDGQSVELRDYFLDRREVTNAEFDVFVHQGGYRNPELWDPIVRDGEVLSFADAMALFKDRTGRPGPSTWQGGEYPAGEADFPVSGLSWYEAAAYARFKGEELPTVHHWQRAAPGADLPWLLPASNLDGTGPVAAGTSTAMSYSGAVDLIGNVREWGATAVGEQRLIFGGGWSDLPSFATRPVNAAAPLDRSPSNGLRLAKTHDEPATANLARAPVQPVAPERAPLPSVPDATFEGYSRVFVYDQAAALNASIDASQTTRLWTRQRISFDAAYGNERMVLYLYLPSEGSPPYQTVLYWPGSPATYLRSIDEYGMYLDFVVKSGRALAFPVYKGTFERGDRTPLPRSDTTAYRDNAIVGVKDLRRSIDYLETRSDINRTALAYFGHSWGGLNGGLVLTQEPRLRTGIIYVGFLRTMPLYPEVDPNFALPRVKIPVLMLSSEFDSAVPIENARRYFELIGTPAPDKRHVIANGGHFVPRDELIRETLDWLDARLGVPGG
jgi:eukaryotic-like serine/threonine-protein kinase